MHGRHVRTGLPVPLVLHSMRGQGVDPALDYHRAQAELLGDMKPSRKFRFHIMFLWYFLKEQSYKPLYSAVMSQHKRTDPKLPPIIKQYASHVENQEGRKRINFRLTMKVSNSVLNTKKPSLFIER